MEATVSSAIVQSYFKKFQDNLSLDVVVVGGGPSGLVASETLAKKGYKVALYDAKLAPGGGMWGGAMMMNELVIQKKAWHVLDEYNINYQKISDELATADSVQSTSSLIYHCTKAGVKIFSCVSVEDVIFLNNRVSGVVINWTAIGRLEMHVDPLMVRSKFVLDATGHPSEVVRLTAQKNNVQLNTANGKIVGEMSLSIDKGETSTVENTKEAYPGLFVSGMAANGVFGSFRMGPIFGGMLLSGKKAAELIEKELLKNE
ncbi:MAG TPA: sulfide-dependent adenosine diphosphate thiazole synthase [Candidatus Cloacimonadota bacterium]|nr:sulfide-dependent adenosine diphosphate thiazole synthase [Candidatus Cloacimonadota bacterium]